MPSKQERSHGPYAERVRMWRLRAPEEQWSVRRPRLHESLVRDRYDVEEFVPLSDAERMREALVELRGEIAGIGTWNDAEARAQEKQLGIISAALNPEQKETP